MNHLGHRLVVVAIHGQSINIVFSCNIGLGSSTSKKYPWKAKLWLEGAGIYIQKILFNVKI